MDEMIDDEPEIDEMADELAEADELTDERPKKKQPSKPAKGSSDLTAMVKAMQQQLTFLERKIDTLLEQSGARPARDRGFSRDSKPFRKSGPRDRDFRGGGDRDRGPRDRNFRGGDRDRGPRDRDFRGGGDRDRGPRDRDFRGGGDRDRAPRGGGNFRGGSKGPRGGGDRDRAPRDRNASEQGVFIRKNTSREHYGNSRND